MKPTLTSSVVPEKLLLFPAILLCLLFIHLFSCDAAFAREPLKPYDNAADIFETDYETDLNNHELLDGIPVIFRVIEQLQYPATFKWGLSKFHIQGEELAAVCLDNAEAGSTVALFNHKGRSLHTISKSVNGEGSGKFIAWDWDRDGTDEIVELRQVLDGKVYNGAGMIDLFFRSQRSKPGCVVNSVSGHTLAVIENKIPGWEDHGQMLDLEGDGFGELVLHDADIFEDKNYTFLGKFGESVHPLSLNWRFRICGTSDTNLDGTPELICRNLETDEIVRVSRTVNQPETNFAGEFEFLSGVLDLDGDGNNELVNGGHGYWNPQSGAYTEFRPYCGNRTSVNPYDWRKYKSLAGDLNGDGNREVIILFSDGNHYSHVGIYELDGTVSTYLRTSSRVVDAVIINQESSDYLLLHTFGAIWAYP